MFIDLTHTTIVGSWGPMEYFFSNTFTSLCVFVLLKGSVNCMLTQCIGKLQVGKYIESNVASVDYLFYKKNPVDDEPLGTCVSSVVIISVT